MVCVGILKGFEGDLQVLVGCEGVGRGGLEFLFICFRFREEKRELCEIRRNIESGENVRMDLGQRERKVPGSIILFP